MPNDRGAGSPQAPDGGGIMGMPLWVWGVGVGAVVLFLWYRHRQSGGGAAVASPVQGVVTTDPNTGAPLDPVTGLPYLTSQASPSTQTLAGWVTGAEGAAKGLGYAPGLVEQALYDFTNGNALTNQESGVINKILGKVGYPPDLLPFFGTIPNPKPPIVTPPIVKKPGPVGKPKPPKPPAAKPPIVTTPHPRVPVAHLSPQAAGENYASSVLKGLTPWPTGATVPKGIVVNPKTHLVVQK